MGRRKPPPTPAPPKLIWAVAQANVGDLRRGQTVEVFADDPRLGHYLRAVQPTEPPATLLGVAHTEAYDAEPG